MMFLIQEGMTLNFHGTIYKVIRARPDGKVVLKLKGVVQYARDQKRMAQTEVRSDAPRGPEGVVV
jgi:hypothetical protein